MVDGRLGPCAFIPLLATNMAYGLYMQRFFALRPYTDTKVKPAGSKRKSM